MTVSTFFGLQTSLRGLLAQQRMLDTTGHNIANASTQGYSRQQAVLQAAPALHLAAGATATGAPAQLGSGVDVQAFRRMRDSFTDLQYRAQASQYGSASAQAQALDQAEAALAEPGEDGLNAQLSAFFDAWSDLSGDAAQGPATKQAVVEQSLALGDAFAAVRGQMATVAAQTDAKYRDLTRPAGPGDPGGEIAQIARDVADLNTTISRAVAVGDSPNDLLDRRDQLLDQLAGYGQISVTDRGDGAVAVVFKDTGTSGTTYPVVDGTTVGWNGPPASWSPGGTLGGLLAATASVGDYVSKLDDLAGQVATLVNGAYGGTFFSVGAQPAASLRVAEPYRSTPTALVGGSGNAGSNDRALAVAALRDDPRVGGAYQAFVARVGAEVRAADRQQGNAKALLDNVEDRRQSVAGVSLDEEMTNLVQFQRGYQASARAMSTMDDLLDVLINRTGRVGL